LNNQQTPGTDRVALVTGAGRGIGRAIAVRLGQDGYAVGLTARSETQLDETAKLVEDAGGRPVAVVADVTDPADVTRVCDHVVERLGEVDVLVNNAAYAGPMRPFWDMDAAQWRSALETNILGPVYFLQALLPVMMRRHHGYVININSLQGSNPHGSPLAYAVSKAGLIRLTDGLASQLADSGVVVFDLSPGLVRTEMTAGRPDLDALPESAWALATDAAEQVSALISGRYRSLHGRFIRATDDLDGLCTLVKEDPGARLLRLTRREVVDPRRPGL
jgi:3-oxoacyl-[acyl-carrier protein] reductase